MMEVHISQKFAEIDTSCYPDFYYYKNTLDRALWVLWVVKEELRIKGLAAEEIASIIRDAMEIKISAMSITRAFNRAKDKIDTYYHSGQVYYRIMKPGKDHLKSEVKEGYLEIFYFEPYKPFSSKTLLSNKIMEDLKGELRIVDPYCGRKTLEVLSSVKNRDVKFLTRVENLTERNRKVFLGELEDFKSENPNIEFRNYPGTDIHDRYIISPDFLVILGHSIKDLGSKESFAIKLNNESNKNIFDAVSEIFNRRWKKSNPIP